jgi:hypothetical protein
MRQSRKKVVALQATTRKRLAELQHLAAPKLLPNDDLLGRINPVNLKYVLGDIQTDRGDLHVTAP